MTEQRKVDHIRGEAWQDAGHKEGEDRAVAIENKETNV